jgi:type IV pilus assembly protein PilM
MAERLESPVDILNPFNAITFTPKEVDADAVNNMGPAAAVAVGLAVRKVGDR